MQACFDEAVRRLDGRGLILRTGLLVDGTLIQAASRKPGLTGGKGAKLEREPGAGRTCKNGKSHYGDQLHVAADQGFNLIRSVASTAAHVAESDVTEALISGDERAVYADKG
jgi:hypothetical protein